MNANKIIILTGSGTGKSTAAECCLNIKDLDSIEYAFIYDKTVYGDLGIEDLKNLINGWLASPENYAKGSVSWNPACPQNYINAIRDEMEKGNTVLVPFIQEVYDLVKQNFGSDDIRKIIVFPAEDNFEEYAERYRMRGNDENFINIRRKEFAALSKLFRESELERIVIGKGKYLTETLVDYGICEKKRH